MENVENALTVPGSKEVSGLEDMEGRKVWYMGDPNDRATALKAMAAMDDTAHQMSECVGKIINVTDVILHETNIMLDDKQAKHRGEQSITAIRTVVIDENGVSYGSVADGVRDSIKQLYSMIGLPPYLEAIPMQITERKTRLGFKTLKLVPVIDNGKAPNKK